MEHINNDQQEREEDNGLPVASKDNVRLAGEEGDKEELGNFPHQSISATSRDVDELLSPLPIINGVGRMSSRLIQECIVAGRVGLLPTIGEGREGATMSPSAGGETAVDESISNILASKFSISMCGNNKESMNPFVANEEDNNKEEGEHSKDEGEYAEEEIPYIRVIRSAMQDQGLSAVERNKKISFVHGSRRN
jgi:hypothetical protein